MLSDCLTPVYAEPGPGTIVTMNNSKVLGEGLIYNRIFVESYVDSSIKHYRIDALGCFLFVPDFLLIATADGWRDPKFLSKTKAIVRIKFLYFACLICGNWYPSTRPIWSYCSRECATKFLGQNHGRLINSEMIKMSAKEDWVELMNVRSMAKFNDVDCVKVTKMETGSSIYANNFLISASHLLA
jgi:hypothetical protein